MNHSSYLRTIVIALVGACSFQGTGDVLPDSALDARLDAVGPTQDAPGADGMMCTGYFASVNSTSWTGAEATCEALGGHLAILGDATEAATVAALAGASVWVGVTDRRTKGTWLDVTGARDPYLPWAPTEPSKGPKDHCVLLVGIQVDASDCGAKHRYVCECDGLVVDPGSYTLPL
ncbi:MAG: C-type lectin domain-containing protein [Proteobacteria bacterium]|nr:C-type lectin domain-containing protein [Pseudomonadota bacterium]